MKIAIRSRQTLAILGLAVLLAVPVAAHPVRQRSFRMERETAQDPAVGKGPREQAAERLNLTQEQREQLRDIRREGRREAVLRRGEMASLRSRIQAEFLRDQVDAAAVQSLGEELGRLTGKAVEARLAQRLAFLEVLTPEQRRMLEDQRGRQRGRPGHRGHGGWGGGGMHGEGPGGDIEPEGEWN